MIPYRPLIYLFYLFRVLDGSPAYDLFKKGPPSGTFPKAKLKNCPRNIEVQADKGKKSAKAYWTPPTEIHYYKVTTTYYPGDTFVGKTTVTYSSSVPDGMTDSCSFDITVLVTRCQKN